MARLTRQLHIAVYAYFGTMAGVGWLSLCFLVVLSAFVSSGHCEFQRINLQSSGVRCNMSSVYKHTSYGNSMNCTGAINNNAGTEWKPISDSNPNCVYTVNGGIGRRNQYWLLDLGQPYNIHRITTYFDAGNIGFMRNRTVLLDGIPVFQFPDEITNPEQTTGGKLPASGQIVKITGPTGYVALCEFQVDECTADSYGVDCEKTCSSGCRANGGSATCDSISGNCTQAASSGTETQDGGNFTGPLVGGLLGAGALIGLSILLGAFIIRRRRSRDTSNTADTDGERVSSGNAPVRDVIERDKPETETPGNESNYAQLEKYEDPDDIRPYSVLYDGGKLPKDLNTQSDKERVLYQNTTLSTASKN